MQHKYFFPIVLIVLDLGAALVYALNKEYKMAVYWLAAAVLNITVTFQVNKKESEVATNES